MKLRPIHGLIVLVVVYFTVLTLNAPSVGYTRDEGYYFKAANQYAGWWETLFSNRFTEAFQDEEIKKHFGYNTEHPPLVKLSQGITHRVFHRWLGLVSDSTGYRLTGYLFAGLSLLATYLLGKSLFSPLIGLIAALFMAAIPRYFFDAHLACFDIPITAMWTLSLWAFWRAYSANTAETFSRSVSAGVIFGLALATKLNSLFLPFVFVALWLWTSSFLSRLKFENSASGGLDARIGPIPWVLIFCAIIGPIVFFLIWPYLWHDPVGRTNSYLAFHLHHEHYPASYFHDVLIKPPFPRSFPFVMTLYTLPTPLLVLGGLGSCFAFYRGLLKREPRYFLLLIAVVLPPFLISMPKTPIFGGVKHWYNAMPALCVLAALCLNFGAQYLKPKLSKPLYSAVLCGLCFLAVLPGVTGIAASPATGIGYYNEIAGGYRGGAALGMQRGFWGGLVRPNMNALQDLKPGSRVFFNRLNYDSYRMYVREGIVPKRVYYANDAKNTAAAFHFEQPEHGEQEGQIWSNFGTRPSCGVYVDNVTLGQVYVKDKKVACP